MNLDVIARTVEDNPIMPEADPDWNCVDSRGHKHFYSKEGDIYPTLDWEIDSEETDEDPEYGHYECKMCKEKIYPRTRIPHPRTIVTAYDYYKDGIPVTKEEFETLWKCLLESKER
jgi:hypothetical protein